MTLDGGAGDDTITSGSGSDVIVITSLVATRSLTLQMEQMRSALTHPWITDNNHCCER